MDILRYRFNFDRWLRNPCYLGPTCLKQGNESGALGAWGETTCVSAYCDGCRGSGLPLPIRSRYFRFVSSLSVSGADWLLLSGVRKPSSLPSTYAGTLDASFGTKPFAYALAAVYRILLRVSHHARSYGAASEDFLCQASIYLVFARDHHGVLCSQKFTHLSLFVACPLSVSSSVEQPLRLCELWSPKAIANRNLSCFAGVSEGIYCGQQPATQRQGAR